jgi:hypothetical protein
MAEKSPCGTEFFWRGMKFFWRAENFFWREGFFGPPAAERPSFRAVFAIHARKKRSRLDKQAASGYFKRLFNF